MLLFTFQKGRIYDTSDRKATFSLIHVDDRDDSLRFSSIDSEKNCDLIASKRKKRSAKLMNFKLSFRQIEGKFLGKSRA